MPRGNKSKSKNKKKARERPVPMPPTGDTEEERTTNTLARIVTPDPSRGLRRLPFTPRLSPYAEVLEAAAKSRHEEFPFEDSDEEEKEQIIENRTIVAPLAHRLTHDMTDVCTLLDVLTVTFHAVEGSKQLLKCDILHKDITPREIKAYYRTDGRVIGVLNNVDDRRHTRTEENVIMGALREKWAEEAAERRRKRNAYYERQRQMDIAKRKLDEEKQNLNEKMEGVQAA
ncbi:hypothetical protein EW145_g4605 [Phellinidium pouzarii]|uniref:Uncharacterized protein n=1 Tax=Phellinidium pouzarii TaxID=167371 RepID=A0A4S4L2Y3_9AGAM|nr:hypothetical protein EW145_g4605 [Phellinidium pouzarii]